MKTLRLTPAAQRDLSSIWDYTQQRWGAGQAETYVAEIHAAMQRAVGDPERGRRCDDIRRGYRRYGIGSHVIFYIDRPRRVDVIRILHQRMDPTRHM